MTKAFRRQSRPLEPDEQIWSRRRRWRNVLLVALAVALLVVVTPAGTAAAKWALAGIGLGKLDRRVYQPGTAEFGPDGREIAWVDYQQGEMMLGCGPDGSGSTRYAGGIVGFRDGSVAGYWRLTTDSFGEGPTIIRPWHAWNALDEAPL